MRQRIRTAGHRFIIDAKGAQFRSQTALHILAHFLAFSTAEPLSHFKLIQTSYIYLLLFLKNSDKEPRTENITKRDAKCKVVNLTEIINIRDDSTCKVPRLCSASYFQGHSSFTATKGGGA